MSDVYIYSTATNAISFVVYAVKNSPTALHKPLHRVTINGGHGLARFKGLDTPKGAVTKVSGADYEILKKDVNFQQMLKDGFLTVDVQKVKPEKKAADMAEKDKSAPLTPADCKKSEHMDAEGLPIYKAK